MVVDLCVIIELAMSGMSGSMIAKTLRELALQQSNETAVGATSSARSAEPSLAYLAQ
jgi:cellobiose-specific phosphotransferase system component IIB